MPDITEDYLLSGAVRLKQPAKGHRFGTDAVLLSRMASHDIQGNIVDLGAGSGAVGLVLLALHPKTFVTFVEKNPFLADLCQQNLIENGFENRGHVLKTDLLTPLHQQGLLENSYDHIFTNPPFFEHGTMRISPEPFKAQAHEMQKGGFDKWIRKACTLLKQKGSLNLVHRADHLEKCLKALDKRFGNVQLQAVHAYKTQPANRILISAVKGSRKSLEIRPPFILHEPDGRFTKQAEDLHILPILHQ